jgi:hypothetical protein
LDDTYGIYNSQALIFLEGKSLNIKPYDKTITIKNPINDFEIYYPINVFVDNSSQSLLDIHSDEFEIKRNDYDLILKTKIKIDNRVAESLRNQGTKFHIIEETFDFPYSISNNVDLLDVSSLKKYINTTLPEKEKTIYNTKVNFFNFKNRLKYIIKSNMITTVFNVQDVIYTPFNSLSTLNFVFSVNTNKKYSGLWQPTFYDILFTKVNNELVCNLQISAYKVL